MKTIYAYTNTNTYILSDTKIFATMTKIWDNFKFYYFKKILGMGLVRMWQSEDKLQESAVSSHHVC